ncbi:hypothetical protein ACLB6G_15955 [Zhengella sp. ZM62]|uniref:hypothetical protein n=1 Tax=Zhengella sedimenti TaxID=3390035 RepID=UPI0039758A77
MAFGAQASRADDVNYISQNIQGFNLPGVQLPQGADEVRAADGTTCRSAVSGNGAYLDVGVIGTPKSTGAGGSTASAYGRIVIPLGRSPKRLDCSQLYALEVERLKMELRLMQMGLGAQAVTPDPVTTASTAAVPAKTLEKADDVRANAAPSRSKPSSWADEGWSTDGRK